MGRRRRWRGGISFDRSDANDVFVVANAGPVDVMRVDTCLVVWTAQVTMSTRMKQSNRRGEEKRCFSVRTDSVPRQKLIRGIVRTVAGIRHKKLRTVVSQEESRGSKECRVEEEAERLRGNRRDRERCLDRVDLANWVQLGWIGPLPFRFFAFGKVQGTDYVIYRRAEAIGGHIWNVNPIPPTFTPKSTMFNYSASFFLFLFFCPPFSSAHHPR